MTDPLVSIVLPVYNAERYLQTALASMFAQSFTNWELIGINDGSCDGSARILEACAASEPRMRVLHQENQGIVQTLNRGIAAARGSLICRMDADDIAMPQRLAQQVAFMQQHPQHVVVGGAILKIDSDSDPLGVDRLATSHEQIEQALLSRQTGLFHPATLIRAQALAQVGGYRSEYEWVEDHDLWLRLAQAGRLANLDEVILCYRLHASSICWQRTTTQRQRMSQLLTEAYAARGKTMPAELQVESDLSRSPAGPGKWARMAAKGCAPRTALKHLKRLWQEPADRSYRWRMTFETLIRLTLSLPQLSQRQIPAVPQL